MVFQRTDIAGDAILLLQILRNGFLMLPAHLPDIRRSGILPCSGICNIEQVAKASAISAVVNDCDAYRAALDISAHLLIPDFIAGNGGGFRSLEVDADLFVVGVLVKTP